VKRSGMDWRGAVVPIAAIVIVQVYVMTSRIKFDNIAAPTAVAAAGWQAVADGTLLRTTLETLGSALGGLAIGTVLGLALGLLFGLWPPLNRAMLLSVEAVRPIPSVALVPVALLIFGFGYRMEMLLVAHGTLWPVLIFTRAGVRAVEPRLLEVSRLLGFNLWQRIWRIVLPAALSQIFVGFRVAAALALVIAVTVEISANPLGIGNGLMTAEQTLRPGLMYAFIVWLGLIGWTLNAVLVQAQRRLWAR
jgi:ABC-type nitrate/sulfonate/bicarbonate transport system permease component